MKKILSIMLIGTMLIMAGCGQKANDSGDNQDPSQKVSSGGATSGNKLEEIKQAGKIVIGTSADYPPYEFHMMIDGKDEIVGFDVEIMKELAKGLGVELEIQDLGFDAVLAGVGSGLIDIGVAGINSMPEREEAMDFSDVYYKASHTIIVAADKASEYKSPADLEGKTIGAQLGTLQEQVAKEEIAGATVKSLGKVTDLILELKTGMIDAIILELPVAKSYEKQNADLKAVDQIIFEKMEGGSTVITANGETALMAEINKILAELKASGKIDQFVAAANELADQAIEK